MNSSILDERFFRGADCETDHNLVFAKVRDRLALSTEAAQMFYVEKINLRKLIELDVKKHYNIKISNRCAASDSLIDKVDISRAWENSKVYIKNSTIETLGLTN